MIKWLSSILGKAPRGPVRGPEAPAAARPPPRTPYRGGPRSDPTPIVRFEIPEFSEGFVAAPEAGCFFVQDRAHRLSGHDLEGNELSRSFPLVGEDEEILGAAPGRDKVLLALSPSGALLARASSNALDIVDSTGRIVWRTDVEPSWGSFEALAFDRSGSILWLLTERPETQGTAVFAFDPEVAASPPGTFEIRGDGRSFDDHGDGRVCARVLPHRDEDRAVMVTEIRQDEAGGPHCVLVALRAEPTGIVAVARSTRMEGSALPIVYGSNGFLMYDAARGALVRRRLDGTVAEAGSAGARSGEAGWNAGAASSTAALLDGVDAGVVLLFDTSSLELVNEVRIESDGRAPCMVVPFDRRRLLAIYGHPGINPFTQQAPGHWVVLWKLD